MGEAKIPVEWKTCFCGAVWPLSWWGGEGYCGYCNTSTLDMPASTGREIRCQLARAAYGGRDYTEPCGEKPIFNGWYA